MQVHVMTFIAHFENLISSTLLTICFRIPVLNPLNFISMLFIKWHVTHPRSLPDLPIF